MKDPADLIGITAKKKKKGKEATAAMLEAKKAKEGGAIEVLPEGVTEILHKNVHGTVHRGTRGGEDPERTD